MLTVYHPVLLRSTNVKSDMTAGLSVVGFMYSWAKKDFSQCEPAEPGPPPFSRGTASSVAQLKCFLAKPTSSGRTKAS